MAAPIAKQNNGLAASLGCERRCDGLLDIACIKYAVPERHDKETRALARVGSLLDFRPHRFAADGAVDQGGVLLEAEDGGHEPGLGFVSTWMLWWFEPRLYQLRILLVRRVNSPPRAGHGWRSLR